MDDFLMYESAEEYYNSYIDDDELFSYGTRCSYHRPITDDRSDELDDIRGFLDDFDMRGYED